MTADEARQNAEDFERKAKELWEQWKRVEAETAPYLKKAEEARQVWYDAYQDAKLFARMAEIIERSAK